MKILVQFRILRWWRWLRAVNKLIEWYLNDEYCAFNCPFCHISKDSGNCKDCLWVRFEGVRCTSGRYGLEPDYKERLERLRRWKYRMYWGKKAYIKKYEEE